VVVVAVLVVLVVVVAARPRVQERGERCSIGRS